ncbi:MAG: hypothetical protein JSW38_10540 [Dehalococcoidia bacterium]|nr:MAG: hypothetical protein JSV02_02810 [Dehalococcoidia bacterium]UCG82614.1 MAG: hypothetical protein JSW38_10540 [Dehalococcoidia bacterium]
MKRSTMLLIVAFCLIIAFILQAIFLARYVGRLPDDWVGIGIFIAALIAFALVSVGYLIQWKSQRYIERRGLKEEDK